ncbi:FMNH2-dependent monooxygenase [Subtercola boreus]|uniref:FMNH2-dependent monooxygenase n=1 Tax=Subtercola boreus TaxID=120213 RepID=A0A3E0VNU3_9MICO|nr:FMNH2-dependent monooxygenase [Subtercola boreus]
MYLGIALDGAGWHPAAWREEDARPHDLFDVTYYADLVRTAKQAGADLVTFEDAVGLQSSGFGPVDERRDEVRGRLDALVLANAIAPVVGGIGLVPTITTTHIEPFHTATGIQTLDYTSEGWAGWRVQVSGRAHEAAHFGRRDLARFDPATLQAGGPAADAQLRELFDEARDSVEVARRLWDSWEDGAIIRDVPTGRFIDREKLHYIDFEGAQFTVRGPSIVPRSPQGQPLVYVLAHQTVPYELAVAEADIVGVTPRNDDELSSILNQLHTAGERVERRTDDALRVWAEAVVLIEDTAAEASSALDRLDVSHGSAYTSDALLIVGSPADVADQLAHWHERGLDGVRLRPARLPYDLDRFASDVAPLLAAGGLLERPPGAQSLRERLGSTRPANRYARTESDAR